MAKKTNKPKRKKTKAKKPKYVPTYTKRDCIRLARLCIKAGTLVKAAELLQGEADRLIAEGKPNKQGTWAHTFNKVAKQWREGKAPAPIFQLKGNKKLPFANFSTLPGFTCPGAGQCLNYCYSYKGWRYPSAFLRQLQNTILVFTHDKRIGKAWRKLKQGITVRLYVDGDIDSARTLRYWMRAMHTRPDLKVYGYSKSWAIFIAADDNGMAWPNNYALNFSGGSRYEKSQAIGERLAQIEPIKRGEYLAVDISAHYHPTKKLSNKAKYGDKKYHKAVREAAEAQGLGKVFSCPGQCGDCTPSGHACGSPKFIGVRIAIGIH